jgi:hypothetical protein
MHMEDVPHIHRQGDAWVFESGRPFRTPVLGRVFGWFGVHRQTRFDAERVSIGAETRPWTDFDRIAITGGVDEPERIMLFGPGEPWILLHTEARVVSSGWTVDQLHRFANALASVSGLPVDNQLPEVDGFIEEARKRFDMRLDRNRRRFEALHDRPVPAVRLEETADLDGWTWTLRADARLDVHPHVRKVQVTGGPEPFVDGVTHRLPLASIEATGVTFQERQIGSDTKMPLDIGDTTLLVSVESYDVHLGTIWALVGDRTYRVCQHAVGLDGTHPAELLAIAERIEALALEARQRWASEDAGSEADVPEALSKLRPDRGA